MYLWVGYVISYLSCVLDGGVKKHQSRDRKNRELPNTVIIPHNKSRIAIVLKDFEK